MQDLQIQIVQYTPRTSLTIISMGRVISIPFSEIVRIYKKEERTIVVTKDNEYLSGAKLYLLQRELPENDFLRVHQSHIVALDKWDELKRDIPLSMHYKKQLGEQFRRRLDSQYRTILYRPV